MESSEILRIETIHLFHTLSPTGQWDDQKGLPNVLKSSQRVCVRVARMRTHARGTKNFNQ